MGGKLTMTMSTSHSMVGSVDSSSFSTMASRSFSASVSGWGASASAAANYADSISDSSSSQSQFESSTSKSSIITYGGAPGSFGPSGGTSTDAPGNWGDWAQTVDLLPVPVRYTLDRVYNILPAQYQPLWLQGEELYYTSFSSTYLFFLFFFLANFMFADAIGFDNQYTLEITYSVTAYMGLIGPIGVRLIGESGNSTLITILDNQNSIATANSPVVYKILDNTTVYGNIKQLHFTFHASEIGSVNSVNLCLQCVQGIPSQGEFTDLTIIYARLVDYNLARETYLRPSTQSNITFALVPNYPNGIRYDVVSQTKIGLYIPFLICIRSSLCLKAI